MLKRILDTSVLLRQWHKECAKPLKQNTVKQARAWADRLVALERTDAIVTPVYIEMVAGVRDEHELELTRAYLGQFRCLDEGKITAKDWQEANRIAQRIPRKPRPRDLGDCLIRAIANRLNHEVSTFDEAFPG